MRKAYKGHNAHHAAEYNLIGTTRAAAAKSFGPEPSCSSKAFYIANILFAPGFILKPPVKKELPARAILMCLLINVSFIPRFVSRCLFSSIPIPEHLKLLC